MPRLLRWLPFVLFAAFLGAGVYGADTGYGPRYWTFLDHIPFGDKTGHFCLMGTLSLLLNLALRARTVRLGPVTVLLGSFIVALVVTAEEGTQYFLPSRNFDFNDLAADYLGIFLAGRLAVGLLRKPREKMNR